MKIFQAVKDFFCEEEPKKTKYDPDPNTTYSVSAEKLFPVSVLSDPDAMREILQRKEIREEIEKKAQAEFVEQVKKQKAALDQPRPAAAPETARPSWQTVSDDL